MPRENIPWKHSCALAILAAIVLLFVLTLQLLWLTGSEHRTARRQ